MKEIPKRYTNPFLSDEENEKVWNQELERSNIEDDLTNNCEEDKLINCLAPSEFCEKETELFTDKIVLECEVPESLICYKEGAFHVKDICVDEGIAHGERVLFDENNNVVLKPNLCCEVNGKIDTGLPVLEPSNDHMNIGDTCDEVIEKKSDASSVTQEVDIPVNEPINDQDLQDSKSDYKECGTNEEVINSIIPNELNEVSKSDSNNGDGLSDTVSKAIDNNGPGISLQPGEEQINSSGSSSLQQDQSLPSLKSLLESIDQQPCQSPVEKNSKRPVENAMDGNTTLNLSKTEPAASSTVHNIETLERADEHSITPHGAPKLQDVGSDNIPVVNPLHRGGEGESGSGLVTYSWPIVFNGSTSLRSDSSTTSTRSFAFPILQNEWNSSPVRMAKADRRRLPKHRGWMHGLLCCRF
ncbi:hypothetical protein L1987_16155 [Smallanthus sonchifolius]|uniref:Uncharacterized protein n=1 Tax=Smallanthus sonchifolius TaxID=185202 RepID=A0ACB9J7Y4_9ASTR|nr:hypothetical protein L1987_16155 [Smallanthus sonchifolius]